MHNPFLLGQSSPPGQISGNRPRELSPTRRKQFQRHLHFAVVNHCHLPEHVADFTHIFLVKDVNGIIIAWFFLNEKTL